MNQLPERAVALDRLSEDWDHQHRGCLPPSNLRAGDVGHFALQLLKLGQTDVPIEVIGQAVAEYVYGHFHNSRDPSGVFLRLQGGVEKKPGWPLWEHFHIWNLAARSPSEIQQSHPPTVLSLTSNILRKKGWGGNRVFDIYQATHYELEQ